MSKLALRIFVSLFAALVITVLGAIAVTSWMISERKESADAELLVAAQAAAAALADGGVPALTKWAASRTLDSSTTLEILVIDETGNDLLGRRAPSMATTPSPEGDDFFGYDLPAVLLNLPTKTPELISDEGEAFRLISISKRTGFAVLRDVPLPVLLLSLIVTALVSLWLARSITRPIIELQQTTESLASGNLNSRVPRKAKSRRDEIGRLARSLDTMTNQLAALIKGQQQLLRDVSHELRSPLTRIRLASGLLTQRDASMAATTARIDEEVSRLDELIEKILDVSRVESGAIAWTLEPLELRSVVERVMVDASFEASQLGKSLSSQLDARPLEIVGDRDWIQSAIENVVRNALKHSPAGASVEVLLDQYEGFARLRVRDTGLGLPPDELTKIFEPFFRSVTTAAERSSASAGLGLAITARVVRGHHGQIAARNLSDSAGRSTGFEIDLQWPLAKKLPTDDQTANAPSNPDPRFRG
jgi:two-component system OmpR family sensor kinase